MEINSKIVPIFIDHLNLSDRYEKIWSMFDRCYTYLGTNLEHEIPIKYVDYKFSQPRLGNHAQTSLEFYWFNNTIQPGAAQGHPFHGKVQEM